jgi:hypothetical protein
MGNKAGNVAAIILLIGSTASYGHKAVPSTVSASHLVRHGNEVNETRIHLMRDHRLYIEEITQDSSYHPNCKMHLAVLPEPAFQRIKNVMRSTQFSAIQNRQNQTEAKPGHDEIWHIAFHDGPTRFFTFNPPQSHPPADFIVWFEEAKRLRPHENIALKADSYRCTLFSEEMSHAWQQ